MVSRKYFYRLFTIFNGLIKFPILSKRHRQHEQVSCKFLPFESRFAAPFNAFSRRALTLVKIVNADREECNSIEIIQAFGAPFVLAIQQNFNFEPQPKRLCVCELSMPLQFSRSLKQYMFFVWHLISVSVLQS